MLDMLWIIPALPLAAFVALVMAPRLPRAAQSIIGVAPAGAAAVLATIVFAAFCSARPPTGRYVQHVWTWLNVAGLSAQFNLYLDPLSSVFMLVVCVVGFLILLYSVRYMAGDDGYGRFFAYMNLFVCFMLLLVLADNLLMLYLGWEGVGLCSYLLIAFWYRDDANVRAGRKAFIVTRIGDSAFILGIVLLFTQLGTMDIQQVLTRASAAWPVGSGLAAAAAALILAGAIGKSAQLPLSTWLPDAMAGPTPTSALIHAATMVTAGVYLLARTESLIRLAPVVQLLIAIIGAATLIYGACAALAQRDLKRVLAYSTISQIGYMFMAIGVAAPGAATFHFVTHAFFKSLLFLGAGVVILAAGHQNDMFRMGGLRKQMPLVFWCFLIGAASLAALPLVTAGWYSKDLVLAAGLVRGGGYIVLWAVGVVGAGLTAAYAFRMVFLVFYGTQKLQPHYRPDWVAKLPLVVLAAVSIAAGVLTLPRWMGGWAPLEDYLAGTFTHPFERMAAMRELAADAVSSAASLIGIYAAYLVFVKKPALRAAIVWQPATSALSRFWLAGWGLDRLYDRLFVRPVVAAARLLRGELLDLPYSLISGVAVVGHWTLSFTQTGRVRWYVAGAAAGAIFILAMVVFS